MRERDSLIDIQIAKVCNYKHLEISYTREGQNEFLSVSEDFSSPSHCTKRDSSSVNSTAKAISNVCQFTWNLFGEFV